MEQSDFWKKAKITSADLCWQWKSAIGPTGYGAVWNKLKRSYDKAHRKAFEFTFGKISKGMYICHTCDNKLCINPNHLFEGTAKDNVEDMIAKGRGVNQKKTHCPKGHEYNLENTAIYGNGRYCKSCAREKNAKYRAYKKSLLIMSLIFCISCSSFSTETVPALPNRTLRLNPNAPGLVYQYQICVKKLLGICTKHQMTQDTYDLTDPKIRAELIDSGFVLKVERPLN